MTSSLLRLEEGEGRPASSTFSCRLSCCRSLFASSCSSAAGLVDLWQALMRLDAGEAAFADFAPVCVTRLDAKQAPLDALEIVGQCLESRPIELQRCQSLGHLIHRAVHGAASGSLCRIKKVVARKRDGLLDRVSQSPGVIILQFAYELFQWRVKHCIPL